MSSFRDTYLVIGGSGFLGRHIVEALLARDDVVSVLDIVKKYDDTPFYSADISDESQVSDAISKSGATCVIHTASPVPGSKNTALFWKVNVDGTKAVIQASQGLGVRKLVYTSSAGVVFNGEDVIDADERRPPPLPPMDVYNETKTKAEELVLKANGQKGLLTVALRPAGIFGPGDRALVSAYREVYETNRCHFQVGDNQNLFDFTYVTNVAQAHLLAADKLNDEPPSEDELKRRREYIESTTLSPLPTTMGHNVTSTTKSIDTRSSDDQFSRRALEQGDAPLTIAGQVFFISNGEPLPFWDIPRFFWSRLDQLTGQKKLERRRIVLSRSVGMVLAWFSEWWCWLVGKEPTFTRFRISFSCVNRWHNIDKARLLLGYEPTVGMKEGLQRMWDWYVAEQNPAST